MSAKPIIRERLDLHGRVQGVGFRPCVYRVASALDLGGFVANTASGAVVEVEGPAEAVAEFAERLRSALPPLARIRAAERTSLRPRGESRFRIAESAHGAPTRAEVMPDVATCSDCRRELFDPADRRYRYPFINCTNCGPRYTIIRDVPYDRPVTTMAAFEMCPDCVREYRDPADRRYHAQPIACPACGPALRLVDARGRVMRGDPLRTAAAWLVDGRIVAIKGLGGYHLACRADGEHVVRRLRRRKIRDGKPLAVMVPDLAAAARLGQLTPADERALTSSAAPIVLVRKRVGTELASGIAPSCPTVGLMLPYTPLHHLLMAEVGGPLVMTSANLSGRPLAYRDDEALAELGDVADALLMHNREIHRPIDDSVVFTFRESVVPVRRARGFVPEPIALAVPADAGGVLATGGELKNTVCLLDRGRAIVSEHLGDLTNPAAYRRFQDAIERLCHLYALIPCVIAHDMHPAYLSTEYAMDRVARAFDNQHGASDQSRDREGADSTEQPKPRGPLPNGRGADSASQDGRGANRPARRRPHPGNGGTNRPDRRRPHPGNCGEKRPARRRPHPGNGGTNRPDRRRPRPGNCGEKRPASRWPQPGNCGKNRQDRRRPRPAGDETDGASSGVSRCPARVAVQHHHAHVAAVMAEAGEDGPLVGLACDGTGYGADGAVWGCELLRCQRGAFQRLGHLEYFPLPGGDAAAIETWRPAASVLRQAFGATWRQAIADAAPGLAKRFGQVFAGESDGSERAWALFERLLDRGVNAPPSSSLGRVFDAAAFMLGLCERNRHEAEAGMALEAAAAECPSTVRPWAYEFVTEGASIIISLRQMWRSMVAELGCDEPVARLAGRFHETLARALADAAAMACRRTDDATVAVSGGCFLNRLLLERVVALLEARRLRVVYPQQVPAGDGGISLGQAYVAAWRVAGAAGEPGG